MYWKRPKKSVLPYLLVFFSDTELLFNVEFAKCKHRGLTCALFAH